MADNVGIYRFTGTIEFGSLGRGSDGTMSASLVSSGSLNLRNARQKRLLDQASMGSVIDPPSWTQYYVGKRHGFVVSVLSSSDDFSIRWNTFASSSL